MKRFDIYRNGELVETGVGGDDERDALGLYADENGVTGDIKRDGGGLLYVGDDTQGRFRARAVVDSATRAAWSAQYPGVPFGTPTVLAEAITKSGGLS